MLFFSFRTRLARALLALRCFLSLFARAVRFSSRASGGGRVAARCGWCHHRATPHSVVPGLAAHPLVRIAQQWAGAHGGEATELAQGRGLLVGTILRHVLAALPRAGGVARLCERARACAHTSVRV